MLSTVQTIEAHVERADMEMLETSMFPRGISENLLQSVSKTNSAVN